MIRMYTEEDCEDVIDVWLAASLQAHNFIAAEYWKANCSTMRDMYLPASDEILIYKDDLTGKTCAFFALVDDYLAALFVHPAFQKKGIGSRLLRIAKGMRTELCLTVYAKNQRAIDFYKKNGFSLAGFHIETATGERELEMEWKRS